MEKYSITEEAFEKIFMYLRGMRGVYCKNRARTRKFLEAVSFIMRTGVQWIELPAYYGHYKSIPKRFIAWGRKDIWNEILCHFSRDCDS